MKKIMAIALVSLLGFLGCSGDDDGTTPPGQAIPVAPLGVIDTMTPTYKWTPVPGATRYLLLVEDYSETVLIEEWYTSEEGECSSEEGLCSATPDIAVIEHSWKVLACVGEECGLWSDELEFYLPIAGPPSPSERFTDNGDGTVTDSDTGRIWPKDANLFGWENWGNALSRCQSLELAGHGDWRLPALAELESLIDDDESEPALPPGHPFTNVQSPRYWSSIDYSCFAGYAWGVNLSLGGVYTYRKTNAYGVWCVRKPVTTPW